MNTKEFAEKFMDSREAKGCAQATLDCYEWTMKMLMSSYPDELPVTPEEVRRVLNEGGDLSATSRNTILDRLRVAWNWASREGLVDGNPAKMVEKVLERNKLIRFLEEEEVARLLAAAEANKRDYAILALLLDTGIRVGELRGMKKSDLGDTGLRVRGKTGERIVPVSPVVAELIKEQGDERGMWIGHQGELTRSGLQQIVRRLMRAAGLGNRKKIGPHTLRHTFGVLYIMNGGDLPSLQGIMGHTKVETTMKYLVLSNQMIREQHRKHSPFSILTRRQAEYDAA